MRIILFSDKSSLHSQDIVNDFEELSSLFEKEQLVSKEIINISENMEKAKEYNINTLPTLIIDKNRFEGRFVPADIFNLMTGKKASVIESSGDNGSKRIKLLEWKDEYSIVPEIDKQHRKIFEIVNEMVTDMYSGEMRSVYESVLDEMSQYAIYHFKTEEDYFDKFDYVEKDKHKAEHNLFKEKLVIFLKDAEYISDTDILKSFSEILSFLEDWWVGHILHSDKRYQQCFKEHGL